MRTSLDDILGTDVDDGAADGLCRVDHEVVVLSDLEDAELGLLVDDTLIDGIRDSIVDQLAVGFSKRTSSSLTESFLCVFVLRRVCE